LCLFCVVATLAPTNESICVVTLEAYKAVYGREPSEVTSTGVGAVGQSRSMFGWREKDGIVENFPTVDLEKVFFGDSVLAHDEVHINPCHAWFVYTGFCRLASIRQTFHFGSRAFRISSPKIWNSLPPHMLHSLHLDVV